MKILKIEYKNTPVENNNKTGSFINCGVRVTSKMIKQLPNHVMNSESTSKNYVVIIITKNINEAKLERGQLIKKENTEYTIDDDQTDKINYMISLIPCNIKILVYDLSCDTVKVSNIFSALHWVKNMCEVNQRKYFNVCCPWFFELDENHLNLDEICYSLEVMQNLSILCSAGNNGVNLDGKFGNFVIYPAMVKKIVESNIITIGCKDKCSNTGNIVDVVEVGPVSTSFASIVTTRKFCIEREKNMEEIINKRTNFREEMKKAVVEEIQKIENVVILKEKQKMSEKKEKHEAIGKKENDEVKFKFKNNDIECSLLFGKRYPYEMPTFRVDDSEYKDSFIKKMRLRHHPYCGVRDALNHMETHAFEN